MFPVEGGVGVGSPSKTAHDNARGNEFSVKMVANTAKPQETLASGELDLDRNVSAAATLDSMTDEQP